MSITAAQSARDEKHLSQLVRLSDGRVASRRERIRMRLAEGWTLVTMSLPDDAARRRALETVRRIERKHDGWVPTGNERHPDTIAYRAAQRDASGAMSDVPVLFHSDNETHIRLSATEYRFALALVTGKGL